MMQIVSYLRRRILVSSAIGCLACTAPVCWAQRGDVINEELKLLPDDGGLDDRFGASIAIDQGIVAVGSFLNADNEVETGAAYLFDASTGDQLVKLLAEDGALDDFFGISIAIDDGIVAVGATGDDDFEDGSGSVYLFDAVTGRQIAKLVAIDGAKGDRFGGVVAIDDGIVAVGASYDDDNGRSSGSVYLFDVSTGAPLTKLLPNDGADLDQFGSSIAMDNGIVCIGSPGADHNGLSAGAVYLFDATSGVQLAKLRANDGAEDDQFGVSVGIDGHLIVVGAHFDDDNGESSGATYLFDVTSAGQIAKLLPNDGAEGDLFGSHVGIEDGIVTVVATEDNEPWNHSGSAYIFNATTGEQIVKMMPTNGTEYPRFGSSIDMSNGMVAIGARSSFSDQSGAAFLFDSAARCLELTVENLVAGQQAVFTVGKGTPGIGSITMYGTRPGKTIITDYLDYCAAFGIDIHKKRFLPQLRRRFDSHGEIHGRVNVPAHLAGQFVLFQSAEQGTCPEDCISNLVEITVQ